MKFLLLLITIILAGFGFDCEDIELHRYTYHKINSEQKLLGFLNDTKDTDCYWIKPYRASAIMQKAKYSFFPHRKLKYFKQGKNLLEEYIINNPQDIEGRYVRVMTQTHIPSILGYNKEVENDVLFIKNNIQDYDLPESYKELILENIAAIEL